MALRSTFRNTVEGTAWQKQLRDRYELLGVPDVPHLDVKRAVVRPVSRTIAKQIILQYEWLGTMATSNYHYGIFFGEFCAGVCCVVVGGGTAGASAYKEWGVNVREFGTLARGACTHWAPKGSNSKLVSWTCKLVARDSGCRVLIAYADTDAGEIGTIYQACGWAYVGRGSKTTQMIAPNGRAYDQKIIHNTIVNKGKRGKIGWGEQKRAMIDAGWETQETNPKHKYVIALNKNDQEVINIIESKRQPYPKRPGSIDGDALVVQASEGGSNPTSGLHAVVGD